jgi:hypothetical protein
MVAVANQLSGQRVEKICVCGDGPEFKALALAIEEQIKLPTIAFDPLDSVDLSSDLRRAPPADVGRWAPLLGMLLDEAQGERHAIDFLDPKKRPAPPSHKRRNSLIAAGVNALLLIIAVWIWNDLGNRDEANAQLQSRIAANTLKDPSDKKTPLDRAKDTQAAWDEVQKWFDGDAVWIDELARASQKAPDSSKIMVTQLLIASDGRGPSMTVTGFAKDAATIDAAENSLRDKLHRVESRGTSEDSSRPGYTRKFTFVLRPYATEAAAEAASAPSTGPQGRSRFPANRTPR